MHAMTASNLRNAYGGESMAHMRYTVWGARAQQEGFVNVARLFRAIALAETVHASNHFRELKDEVGGSLCASAAVFGLGGTSQNLQGGIDGETIEVDEMYPTYLDTARYQQEQGAQRSFNYALSAEKTHAELFKKARKAVDSGNDVELGAVHVCTVCGWTHEGDLPDTCPICGAKKKNFQTFS